MYFFDNKIHYLPHIHAKYQDDEVVVEISEGRVLEGKIPSNKLKLVFAWIEIHKEELMANWNSPKKVKWYLKLTVKKKDYESAGKKSKTNR